MQTNPQPEEELQQLRRELEGLRQERETLKSRDFYLVAESMTQLVWVVSPDGTMVYVNQSWCDYTGTFTHQQLNQDRWLSLMHEDDQERVLVRWHIALDTGIPFPEGTELRIRNAKTRAYRWFLVKVTPLRDAQNNINEWVGICTDIDEIKRSEEALRRSQHEKDTRLLRLSYKLKTQLKNLKGKTYTLTEKLRKEYIQEVEEALTQMNMQIDTLTNLIDDLLK